MRLRRPHLASIALVASLVAATTAAAQPRATVADFAWLAGSWTGTPTNVDGVAEVTFMAPRASLPEPVKSSARPSPDTR